MKQPRRPQNEINYDDGRVIACSVSHASYACSTIMIGNYPDKYGGVYHPIDPVKGQPDDNGFEGASLTRFLLDLAKGFDAFWQQQVNAGSWNKRSVREFAFVTASVRKEQGLVSQYLDELGFVGTPWIYNLKNETDVRFFVMPVPQLLAILDEYEIDFGFKDQARSSWSKRLNEMVEEEETKEAA